MEPIEYKHGHYYIDQKEDGLWLTLYCRNDKPILTQELTDRLDWNIWKEIYNSPGFVVGMDGPTFKSYLYAPLKG